MFSYCLEWNLFVKLSAHSKVLVLSGTRESFMTFLVASAELRDDCVWLTRIYNFADKRHGNKSVIGIIISLKVAKREVHSNRGHAKHFCGAAALSFPGRPIVKVSRLHTPIPVGLLLNEWSARRRGRYLHNSQQTQGGIIYNKPTGCNSDSIVFINNYKCALHVSDALCLHHQEHYKL